MECGRPEILLPYENELLSSDDDIPLELFSDSTRDTENLVAIHPSSTTGTEKLVAIHPPADLPLPFGIENEEDVVFIDPSSGEGKRMLTDRNTTVPEIFALMRQFVSPVCNRIAVIVKEMLKRNVGVNDIDITMGMSMLQYVVRSEAVSSDQSELAYTIQSLLQNGACPHQRTVFTDMNVFHIAAYFNCWKSIEVVICNMSSDEKNDLINSISSEFEFGTPLHIACANLNMNVAEILIKNGADLTFHDELGRTPISCIPKRLLSEMDRKSAEKLRRMLNSKSGFFTINTTSDAHGLNNMDVDLTEGEKEIYQSKSPNAGGEKATLKVGDHVLVGGTKTGVIRYIGATKFSPGIWCGIELREKLGKNDGSINGVRYFTCERTKGVFTPLSKVIRDSSATINSSDGKISSKSPKSATTNKVSPSKKPDAKSDVKLRIGMSVLLDRLDKEGQIRFVGETDFAPGVWIGLSLTSPVGKNNGTVQGREYFRCKPNHGIMVRPSRITVNGISGNMLLP